MKKICGFLIFFLLNIYLVNSESADLAIVNISISPENPLINQSMLFTYNVVNYGPNITNASIIEELRHVGGGFRSYLCCYLLNPFDEIYFKNSSIVSVAGPYVLSLIVNSTDGVLDNNLTNNKVTYVFNVNSGQGSPIFLKIKEIRLSPIQGFSEFYLIYLLVIIILTILILRNIKFIFVRSKKK